MSTLRSLVFASLVNGSALGRDAVAELASPTGIEAAAAEIRDVERLATGLAARVEGLRLRPDAILAGETLAVLAPLAERSGLREHRAALEEASFRVLDPARYAELREGMGASALVLERLAADTRAQLSARGIDGVVTGRVKSPYSTWRKMVRKEVPADRVFDRVALRVVVGTVAECDEVLALLHGRHDAVAGELDDYIRAPKPNGYRSLHTAVRTRLPALGSPPIEPAPDPLPVAEFQIRTRAMHLQAEDGDLAHWRYKLES